MKPKLNEHQIARARRLHEAGTTFENIGLRLGCAATTVRRALDPEIARQKRLARHQPGAEVKFSAQTEVIISERATFALDAAARLAEIPKDDRGLTARVFGDPLPGRSAFDRLMAAARQMRDSVTQEGSLA